MPRFGDSLRERINKSNTTPSLPTDPSLHELKSHGNPMFSFETYRNINLTGTLFIGSHWHHEIEILCFQKGEACVHVSGNTIAVQSGDVVFVNSEELHLITSQDPDILYHACLFPLEFLYFARPDYTQSHYLFPLSDKEILLPLYMEHGDSFTDAIYSELIDIIATFDHKEAAYQLRIKACLIKILSLVFASGRFLRPADTSIALGAKNQQQLKEILSYIESHYEGRIYLDHIADHFHMSAKYFSQYFKKNFGRGFVEYLNHYRIEKACELLVTTNMHIMDISFSTGFDNFSYFIRKFKSITGYTPATYRKTIQDS
jgi:AraC-like DNA-binding protein